LLEEQNTPARVRDESCHGIGLAPILLEANRQNPVS
jgi:hypothetical protein